MFLRNLVQVSITLYLIRILESTPLRQSSFEKKNNEDGDAMKELQKIMKMDSSADWQEVNYEFYHSNYLDGFKFKKIRCKVRKTHGLSTYVHTIDMIKEDVDLEIDSSNLKAEIEKLCKLLSDTAVQFNITISDGVLSPGKKFSL